MFITVYIILEKLFLFDEYISQSSLEYGFLTLLVKSGQIAVP